MNNIKLGALILQRLSGEAYYHELIHLVLKVLSENNIVPAKGIDLPLCLAISRVLSSDIANGILESIINQDGKYVPKASQPVPGPSDVGNKSSPKDWGTTPVSN